MKALFSDCGKYRYWLKDDINGYAARQWPIKITWVMLNPSIAGREVEGEKITDPTNTRVREFSRAWGYTDYAIVNLFALVATDPRELKTSVDPVGPDNYRHCRQAIYEAQTVVCAWGSHNLSLVPGRAMRKLIIELVKRPDCLGVTQNGSPKHPLYLPKSTPLQFYAP